MNEFHSKGVGDRQSSEKRHDIMVVPNNAVGGIGKSIRLPRDGGHLRVSTQIRNLIHELGRIETLLEIPADGKRVSRRTGKLILSPQEFQDRYGVTRQSVAIGCVFDGVRTFAEIALRIGVDRWTLSKSKEFSVFRRVIGAMRQGFSPLSICDEDEVRNEE